VEQHILGSLKCDQAGSLEIYCLLFSFLQRIRVDAWQNWIPDPRVTCGIRYIEENLSEIEITNRTLADKAGMSVIAYSRLFKEQTGIPPRKYLLKKRVEKACSLLHHSDLTIKQIASACGFSDRYYFTRIFTTTIGVSPGIMMKNRILVS